MRPGIITYAASLMFALFTGWFSPVADAIAQSSEASNPGAPKTIIAAVPRTWPPQYNVDSDGAPKGFAIDIMDAIAARGGFDVEYLIAPNFPEAMRLFDEGKAHVIPSNGITPGRAANSIFTAPLETFYLSIITRKDQKHLITRDGLTGHRIGVVKKNIGEKFLKKRGDITLVVHDDLQKALFSLLSGREEALVFPKSVLLRLARRIGVADQIRVVGTPLLEIKRAMRIHKNQPALAKVLVPLTERFVHSAQYREIYLKWFGKPISAWKTDRFLWIAGSILIGILLLMGGWRYVSVFILNRKLRMAMAAREEAERRGMEQDRILRTTVDAMAQGFTAFDANLRLIAFNRGYENLFHFPPGYLHNGMSIEDVTRKRAEISGEGKDEPWILRHLDRAYSPEERSAERITPDGVSYIFHRKPLPGGGFVTTYTDITVLKQAEKAAAEQSTLLETTFNNVDQGIAVYGPDMTLVAFNQRFIQVGEFPQDFIRLGMPYEDLVRFNTARHGASTETINTRVRERLESIQRREKYEHEVTRANTGTTVLVHRTPMPNGGFILTYTDVTERKMAEEKIRIAMEEAEYANRSKSEFLANMSHELRTPLNAVIGFSEIMKNETFGPLGDEKYEEYARDINNSGEHLLSLINDILDLSKIEAGQMALVEEEFDPMVALRTCLKMVDGQLREKMLHSRLEEPAASVYLQADHRMFKQIVLNMLSNAIKFTNEGGHITIKTWLRTDNSFAIQMIDTGVGIPSDDIPRILQPFTQIEGLLNRTHQGTGLGLPLIKKLIELQDGWLDIQSEVGVGTIVTVCYPEARVIRDTQSRRQGNQRPPVA